MKIRHLAVLLAALSAFALEASAANFSIPGGRGGLPGAGRPVGAALPSTPGAALPGGPKALPGTAIPSAPNAAPSAAPASSLPPASIPTPAAPAPAAAIPGAAQQPGAQSTVDKIGEALNARGADKNSVLGQSFDGFRAHTGYDGANAPLAPQQNSSLRWPYAEERAKIEESQRRGETGSALAADTGRLFRGKGGDIKIDGNRGAAYHGEAYTEYGRPRVALTADTVDNGSWAFIQAILSREQTWFMDWYSPIPASAEKLAVAYAHMAVVFAEITNGNIRSWETRLDHNHQNQGTYFVWSWYEQLLNAAKTSHPQAQNPAQFHQTQFFSWLRDVVSKQVSSDPSFQYSLWERYSGKYYRPGYSTEQDIPANVPRLTKEQFDAANARMYGQDGWGDNSSTQNFVGWILNWFSNRNWI